MASKKAPAKPKEPKPIRPTAGILSAAQRQAEIDRFAAITPEARQAMLDNADAVLARNSTRGKREA